MFDPYFDPYIGQSTIKRRSRKCEIEQAAEWEAYCSVQYYYPERKWNFDLHILGIICDQLGEFGHYRGDPT